MDLQLVCDSMPAAKEYRGQRVVTLRDIDAVHHRPEGTAKRNFTENKHRIIESEDYFYVAANQKDEFRTFDIPNRGLILITESGYLMIAKSFTDDLAWQVQRMLVKNYFRSKASAEDQMPPATTADILKANILTGKALAAAMGINEHQVVMAAIAKTERQTGEDLREFKHLEILNRLKAANIASCQARNRSERPTGRQSIIWWLNDPHRERGEA